MDSVEDLIEEALKNIRSDRGQTNVALVDIMKHMLKTGQDQGHKELGMQFVKLTEASQKSNDQLIKVLALMKKESQDFDGFDEDEKKQLYDELQGAAPEEDSTDAEAD